MLGQTHLWYHISRRYDHHRMVFTAALISSWMLKFGYHRPYLDTQNQGRDTSFRLLS